MPLTFLSGVFYSTHTLPPIWREVSRLNPFFYMIDGFRYGFFGMSDVSPPASLGIVGGLLLAPAGIAEAPAGNASQQSDHTTMLTFTAPPLWRRRPQTSD